MLPPMTFVLARRNRHWFKSSGAALSYKTSLLFPGIILEIRFFMSGFHQAIFECRQKMVTQPCACTVLFKLKLMVCFILCAIDFAFIFLVNVDSLGCVAVVLCREAEGPRTSETRTLQGPT